MFDETIAQRVRPLAAAFRAADLVRLAVRDAGFEVELRRASRSAAPMLAAAPAAAAAAANAAPLEQQADLVTSDLVGVVRFVRPHVNEGQELEADRELAFVEALGIRNPVRSRGRGKVAAVLVTDGQPVEYGQPLFAIER